MLNEEMTSEEITGMKAVTRDRLRELKCNKEFDLYSSGYTKFFTIISSQKQNDVMTLSFYKDVRTLLENSMEMKMEIEDFTGKHNYISFKIQELIKYFYGRVYQGVE